MWTATHFHSSFSLVSMHFCISSLISWSTHSLFSNILLSLQVIVVFPVFSPLWLNSTFIHCDLQRWMVETRWQGSWRKRRFNLYPEVSWLPTYQRTTIIHEIILTSELYMSVPWVWRPALTWSLAESTNKEERITGGNYGNWD